eukprot:5370337-Pyramimonas_sp.AAC.1
MGAHGRAGARDGHHLPDVRPRGHYQPMGGGPERSPAGDPVRVPARHEQLQRRPQGVLGRLSHAQRAAGGVHLGLGRP